MHDDAVHLCPRDGCAALVHLATAAEASQGAPIWTCAIGHHGPRIVGYDGLGLS